MFPSFLAKYTLINKIGEGSFSEVLKCENKQTGVHFAAKRLKKTYERVQDILFTGEMQVARKIGSHPNIVSMQEFYYNATSKRVVFLFELMDMSMYEFMKLRKKGIPEGRVKSYAYQILRGLHHLHSNGIFHRDVKPENILVKISQPNDSSHTRLRQVETVKLADCGSIRGIYSEHPYTEYISTRWYRAPECLLSIGHYGPKMDVWAMGCVLYEMLTLQPLFAGEDEIDQLAKIHEIVGTPNQRMLNKLKIKSRNCLDFPKKAGIGFKAISNTLSEDVVNVLQQMIQYDPDTRINIRRILDHTFFKHLREDDSYGKVAVVTTNQGGDVLSKSKDESDFYNIFDIIPDRTTNKYKNKPTRSRSKDAPSARIGLTRRSKTSINIANYKPDLKQHHDLHSHQSVVDQKQIKSWGVNPSMLKSKEEAVNKGDYQRFKSLQFKPRQQTKEQNNFNKTTSNLPQITNYTRFLESIRAKHFVSKSFVLPLRHEASNLNEKQQKQEPVMPHSHVTKMR